MNLATMASLTGFGLYLGDKLYVKLAANAS